MTNDPKDRHVLAAAVRGHAGLIVTANIKDFPASALDSALARMTPLFAARAAAADIGAAPPVADPPPGQGRRFRRPDEV